MKPSSSFLLQIRTDPGPWAGSIRGGADAAPEGWGDFLSRTRALGGGLAGYGLEPGDRVAVVGDFGPEFLEAMLAIWLAGGTAVPLKKSEEDIDVQGALRRCRARMALAVDLSDLERLLRVRPDLPDLELILVFASPGGERPLPARTVGEVERSGRWVLRERPELFDAPVAPPTVMVLAASAEGPGTRRRDASDLDRGVAELAQRWAIASSDRVLISLDAGGGLELDVAGLVLQSGADLVFVGAGGLHRADLRKIRPTRMLVRPEVIAGLERGIESEIGSRGFFGRRLGRWALRTAGNAARAPRRARWAEKAVLRELRRAVTGGQLEEALCPGPVPETPCLRALGVSIRSIGAAA